MASNLSTDLQRVLTNSITGADGISTTGLTAADAPSKRNPLRITRSELAYATELPESPEDANSAPCRFQTALTSSEFHPRGYTTASIRNGSNSKINARHSVPC